ncbi:hypothetical protein [Yoonia sp. BS5-3]|uniref:Tat pathway signal sequence domain protein n=1 Tax=Yoonia phaeophyticola TaxID=3137369 RepID=A0ABZ2V103_9RHOB
MKRQTTARAFGSLALAAMALIGPAHAQAETAAPGISIELNSTVEGDNACRLVFMVENKLSADVQSAVFETVLFTTDGVVERLTLFDFQTLPQGTPRVRQFDLGGLSCSNLGRVLFNGVQTCTAAQLSPEACGTDLKVTSRTDVEVLG